MATAPGAAAARTEPAGEMGGATPALESGAGVAPSADRAGAAATPANAISGRTAKLRREPAEGRSRVLRGLAPAMERGRLVRLRRESG